MIRPFFFPDSPVFCLAKHIHEPVQKTQKILFICYASSACGNVFVFLIYPSVSYFYTFVVTVIHDSISPTILPDGCQRGEWRRGAWFSGAAFVITF